MGLLPAGPERQRGRPAAARADLLGARDWDRAASSNEPDRRTGWRRPIFRICAARCFSRMSTDTFDASEHGNKIPDVLDAVKDEYRVRYREVDEEAARQALNHHRPVIATFSLYDRPRPRAPPRSRWFCCWKPTVARSDQDEEWDRFGHFFRRHPTGWADVGDIQCKRARTVYVPHRKHLQPTTLAAAALTAPVL